MVSYSILVSIVLIIILFIQGSPHIWPGIFFLLSQSVLIFLMNRLIKAMRKRRKPLLIPVINQFKVFFGVMFPLWITLAVFDQLTTIIGRIFSTLFFIIFFALNIVLLIRLMSGGDLLDRFDD